MRLIFVFALLSLLGCQSEPASESAATTQTTETAPPIEAPAIEPAPRSGGCNFIPDEKIVEIIAGELEGTSISNLPGRTVSACYYRLDNMRWSGDFVVEVADGADASKILKSVEAAPATEKLNVSGHPAQLTQGSRILRVATAPPFELKLSILPKAGYKEYADDTDRKRMLTELAEILAKR